MTPWDEWDLVWLLRAIYIAESSQCCRKKTGCCIVSRIKFADEEPVWEKDILLGSSYNKPPEGQPTCQETGGCLIGERHGREGCRRCLHAEIGALAAVSNELRHYLLRDDSTAYVTLRPCLDCALALLAFGVKRCVHGPTNETIPPEYANLVQDMTFVSVSTEALPQLDRFYNQGGVKL